MEFDQLGLNLSENWYAKYNMKLNGHHIENVILLMLEYDVNLIITNFSTSGIGNSSGFLSSPGLMFSIANETEANRIM